MCRIQIKSITSPYMYDSILLWNVLCITKAVQPCIHCLHQSTHSYIPCPQQWIISHQLLVNKEIAFKYTHTHTHTHRYPFSGSCPTNLARLHASVSHYSPSVDNYEVKILIASGLEEMAQLVRRIADDAHRNSKVTQYGDGLGGSYTGFWKWGIACRCGLGEICFFTPLSGGYRILEGEGGFWYGNAREACVKI